MFFSSSGPGQVWVKYVRVRLGRAQRNQIKVLDLSYKIKLVYRGDMRVYFRESKVFRKTQEEF